MATAATLHNRQSSPNRYSERYLPDRGDREIVNPLIGMQHRTLHRYYGMAH